MDFHSLENHTIFQKSFYTNYLVHLPFPFFRYLLLFNKISGNTQLFISMCLDLINITTDFLFSLRLSLKGMLKP